MHVIIAWVKVHRRRVDNKPPHLHNVMTNGKPLRLSALGKRRLIAVTNTRLAQLLLAGVLRMQLRNVCVCVCVYFDRLFYA